MSPPRSDAGFSLVELVVVVAILAVLAGIATPIYLSQRRAAFDATATADLRALMTAQRSLEASQQSYSEDPTVLRRFGYASSREVVACARVSGDHFTVTTWHPDGRQRFVYDTTVSAVARVDGPALPSDCASALSGSSRVDS